MCPQYWPMPTGDEIPALLFRWTSTHSFIFSADHIFSICVDESQIEQMKDVPAFVERSRNLPGEIKLDLAGIEKLEQILPEIKALLRGEVVAMPTLSVRHFENN